MKEKIIEELNKIEKIENIKIIYAVESGSRAWGFAGTDSDYDVRFIYVRNEDFYLKLENHFLSMLISIYYHVLPIEQNGK